MSFFLTSCDGETNKQKSSVNIVYNKPVNGSVRQVKTWCEENLENPESLEFFRWGLVKKTEDGFTVRSKYRFRDASGEYVISDHLFYMDINGNIIKVLDNE